VHGKITVRSRRVVFAARCAGEEGILVVLTVHPEHGGTCVPWSGQRALTVSSPEIPQTRTASVAKSAPPPHDNGVLAISIFKLISAGLLLAVGIGALTLVHRGVGDIAESIVAALQFRTDTDFMRTLLERLDLVSSGMLRGISAATLAYSALMFVEGFGLLYEQVWAEYLTVIVTSSFIPFEVFELVRHAGPTTAIVLSINAAIVAYLVYVLVSKGRRKPVDTPKAAPKPGLVRDPGNSAAPV
jgi:uncharacterized membrane protein (DUF2068 family)